MPTGKESGGEDDGEENDEKTSKIRTKSYDDVKLLQKKRNIFYFEIC